MFVSPAEPPPIKALLRAEDKISVIPEQWGCDFLMFVNKRWIGVQRKEVKDLIASVEDGRLAKEVGMMKKCDVAVVVVEGHMNFTTEGELVGKGFGRNWTKKQIKAILWSVRERGIWVEFSDSHQDTMDIIYWLESWFGKSEHNSLMRRPGPVAIWGSLSNEDYQRHLVMGLPGVGPELAQRIITMFGVPFGWRITIDQLMEVEGIGIKKAAKIWRTIHEMEKGVA